jgi:hypothetical protein
MSLRGHVLNVLATDFSRAFPFDEVVKRVAELLEPEIRATLNELEKDGQIERHPGGKPYQTRYQGKPHTNRPS